MAAKSQLDGGTAQALLETMWTIRLFEERVTELCGTNEIPGLTHVGIGQEAVAAGTCSVLRRDDYVYGSHRCHAPAIAKGADLGRLMAELAGRSGGYCAGKGGSMHIVAAEVGFLSGTGVVGGTLPLAVGSALVCRDHGRGQVVMVFFGDGAAQAGLFHESLNLASLWELPVIFVCENNGYAEFTPLSAHTKVERLASHATTYAIPCRTVDGNDVGAVRQAAAEAVETARGGGGPGFLECLTYRLRGHYVGDPAKYRELSEVGEWKKKDPLQRFLEVVARHALLTAEEVEAVERQARERVEAAAQTALASPPPTIDQTESHVYA
ncbi:MAG: thiamine pyrophosphate-dependent dehydrogenase E1 component subunit alpha [Candidatus Tectomicrobia bacterium]|nr:thiamine pyrophosphate-dependent dehydrogenase E1 component subunit alpha [Candidatus Tectomicrobia bacterium]